MTFPFLRYSIVQLSKTGFVGFCFFLLLFLFWGWVIFPVVDRYKLNGTGAYVAINIKLPLGVLLLLRSIVSCSNVRWGLFSVQSILKHSVGKQKGPHVVYLLYNTQKLYSISQITHPLMDSELLDCSVSESDPQNSCTSVSCLVQTLFTYTTGILFRFILYSSIKDNLIGWIVISYLFASDNR